jgi:hypothetical protein
VEGVVGNHDSYSVNRVFSNLRDHRDRVRER